MNLRKRLITCGLTMVGFLLVSGLSLSDGIQEYRDVKPPAFDDYFPGGPDEDALRALWEAMEEDFHSYTVWRARLENLFSSFGCIDIADELATEFKMRCDDSRLTGWTIITVTTNGSCHDAVMVASPSGLGAQRFYLFDPFVNGHRIIPLEEFEPNKFRPVVPVKHYFLCKKENAQYFIPIGDTNWTTVTGRPLPDPINHTCPSTSQAPTTSGEGRARACPLPRDDSSQDRMPVFSFDPNDKIGSLGSGVEGYIAGGEPLRYVIRFENLETATAPAQEVVISDHLEKANMDLGTLSLGPIAFGNKQVVPSPGLREFSTQVDLRPENNLIVGIDVNLNQDTGLLTWRFTALDPETGELPEDPFAGFLPPNVIPPEGDGSVLFTVMAKEGLATGAEILNQAEIVFDVNLPILTPEWLNTLDNTKPTSQVLPLDPIQNIPDFLVEWFGEDEGAGIQDYTILVAQDDGPFTPWLTNVPDESAIFFGEDGRTYAFYSVAKDQTGNTEDSPEVSDAVTTVELSNRPPIAAAGADQANECSSALGTEVTLNGSGSSDPDSDTLIYKWNGPFGEMIGETIDVSLPLGQHTIWLTVDDGKGGVDSDDVEVLVEDTVPPNLSVTLSPTVIWPPNHKLVDVSATIEVSDVCDTNPSIELVSILSNEQNNGIADGNTASDIGSAILGTDDRQFSVRAERSAQGSGRVYTVEYMARDVAGNNATVYGEIHVPHNR